MMQTRDFVLLMGVCFIWALNVLVGKIILSHFGVPPFFYAGIRFVGVALLLCPLLFPLPERLGRVLLIGLLMGAGHFGLLFVGLTAATPSTAAIVLQLGIPLTAVLSVLFLGERILPLRALGILTAFVGAVVVIWNPAEIQASLGLVAVAGSTASLAVGSILLKRMGPFRPLRLQAWVALSSFFPLLGLSGLTEHGQVAAALSGGGVFIAATIFSILVVTVIAHTAYFGLLQRYPASMVVPLTLAMPVMTILLGVVVTGDQLSVQTISGSALALGGVLLTLRAGSPRELMASTE